MKIVHYLNQFFGGIGGEDQASIGCSVRHEPVGPGRLLEAFLDGPEIVTVICGDNHASENLDEVAAEVIAMVEREAPDAVVLGPAFDAGRYGLVCGELAAQIPARTGIPAVTGLFENNPALAIYRSDAVIVQTGPTAGDMRPSLESMAAVLRRILAGADRGDLIGLGVFPSGRRATVITDETAAERAVAMLRALLETETEPESELKLPDEPPVPAAEPVADLATARVAVVTEAGVVPRGNPDRLATGYSDKWASYSVAQVLSDPGGFLSIHGGFDTQFANESIFRVLPVDALDQRERAGEIGRQHHRFYAATGRSAPVAGARRIGSQIAKELVNEGVQAVILTST